MSDIPVRIVRRRRARDISLDPGPSLIPQWLDDPEQVQPCPCGRPFDPTTCLPVEGDANLMRCMHRECLDWLEHEMDEDEIEMKREWERRMREEDDDE